MDEAYHTRAVRTSRYIQVVMLMTSFSPEREEIELQSGWKYQGMHFQISMLVLIKVSSFMKYAKVQLCFILENSY